jgi:hyaluronan synthase
MAAGFLADAFKWDGGMDVVVTVDSDTRLDPAALAEITRPFSDPTVSAATGLVMASNARDAVLSRLVDLRYVNAFLYERGAYSRVGAVLCCCGSLAAYRAAVVYDNLDEFLTQTFLGVRQQFGDDRAMTNAALKVGRVVLARDAVAETAVPERLNHFLRQQARWGRSFYRESLRALQGLPVSNPAWWLTLIELASQAAFTAALVVSLVIRPALFGHVPAAAWAATIAASGWARSVFVFAVDRPGWTWRDRWLSFALAPAYGGLHLLLLIPLRLWSLLTLREGGWGTRVKGVEVAARPRPGRGHRLTPLRTESPAPAPIDEGFGAGLSGRSQAPCSHGHLALDPASRRGI